MYKKFSTLLFACAILIPSFSSANEQIKIAPDGEIRVNQHPIKLYTVDKHLFEAQKFSFENTEREFKQNLTAEQAAQLEAYALDENWYILVPKDWTVSYWSRGWGTGGLFATFEPKKGKGSISLYSTSGGTAMSAAAIYFPKVKKQAIADKFLSKKEAKKFPKLKLTPLKDGGMLYQGKDKDGRYDGVAFYSDELRPSLLDVQVSLPKAQQHLTKPILNWFILPNEK